MIGIDDITAYVPKLFISTTGEFASIRGIEPAKLSRGIGVRKMAIPDAHEDAATMGAMSLLGLMERNRLLPPKILAGYALEQRLRSRTWPTGWRFRKKPIAKSEL